MTPPIASRTHPTVLPWAAAAGTMLLWASSFVVIRGAADVFAPGSMALLRMAAASCVLVVWGVVVRPVWPRTPRAWALIACWGVAWFALYTITLNAAGHHVDAATASIIYLGVFPTAIAFTFWGFAIRHLPAGPLSSSSLIVPAIVVVMAWLILGETPPPLAALGSVLCLTDAGQAIFRLRRRASAAACWTASVPDDLEPLVG